MKPLTKAQILKIVPEAKSAAMPRWIEPMKATLVDKPFSREGWIFETKYDGIRSLSFIKDGSIKLYSRNHKEMAFRYPEVSNIAKHLKAKEVILDGEIVVKDKKGNANFQMLQSRFGVIDRNEIEQLRKAQRIAYYVFDILYIDGLSLMHAPLLHRKALLKKILKSNTVVQYSDHILNDGISFYKKAAKARLEGIMAKNGKSLYEEHRSNEWLKVKTSMRQEFVIVGYTPPEGSREYFGALHLGVYRGSELLSIGKVGTGFTRKVLKDVFDAMQPYKASKQPFTKPIKTSEHVQWLKPKLVCEVRFSEWTKDLSLRHPTFQGLRTDKSAAQCQIETKHSAAREIEQAEFKASKKVLKPLKKVRGRTRRATSRTFKSSGITRSTKKLTRTRKRHG